MLTHNYALAGTKAKWSSLAAPGREATGDRFGNWTRKRRVAFQLGLRDEVGAFIASEECVD
jgi:hypothetical protein